MGSEMCIRDSNVAHDRGEARLQVRVAVQIRRLRRDFERDVVHADEAPARRRAAVEERRLEEGEVALFDVAVAPQAHREGRAVLDDGAPVWKSTTGLGGPDQT